MPMNRRTSLLSLTIASLAVLFAMPAKPTHAYATYARWAPNSVSFYVNPANMDVPADAADAAVQSAASAWGDQGGANVKFVYAGRATDTATSNDGRNVVFFRNASNGAAAATTYSWWSGSTITDADVIVWDGAYHFFTGTSGCSGGVYVEDVVTHELGHVLGMSHSSVSDATMYPSLSYCSMDMRTLAADDIAGIQSLYGAANTTANTAPGVSITSPSNGGSFLQDSTITFTGSATDSQDGNIGSSMTWRSSLDGVIGSGTSFSRSLSVGTHILTATVTDSGGLSASATRTISVTVPDTSTGSTASTTATLAVDGYKTKCRQQAALTWTGLITNSVDIYRDNRLLLSATLSGRYTDPIGARGGGTYTYKVCVAGTASCTNVASVTF
jgi:hypothetical protein